MGFELHKVGFEPKWWRSEDKNFLLSYSSYNQLTEPTTTNYFPEKGVNHEVVIMALIIYSTLYKLNVKEIYQESKTSQS